MRYCPQIALIVRNAHVNRGGFGPLPFFGSASAAEPSAKPTPSRLHLLPLRTVSLPRVSAVPSGFPTPGPKPNPVHFICAPVASAVPIVSAVTTADFH